jgi:ferredoxin
MPSVTYLPIDLRVDCQPGESVFHVAKTAGIPIPTACNGQASCGLCRVRIVAGEKEISPMNADEKRHLGNVYFINKMRLSCQTKVAGDVTVEIPGMPKDFVVKK